MHFYAINYKMVICMHSSVSSPLRQVCSPETVRLRVTNINHTFAHY